MLDHAAGKNEERGEDYYREEIDNEDAQILSLLPKIPGCKNVEVNNIDDWGKGDDIEFTEDDIVNLISKMDDDDVDKVEAELIEVNKVTHAEVYNAFKTVLAYVKTQSEITSAELALFRKWRDSAAKKRITTVTKQISLDSF